MSRSESAFAVRTWLSALQEAIKEADTCAESDDTEDYEEVAHDGSHYGYIVLWEVQFEVLVTVLTENFLCLNNLCSQAVAVAYTCRTLARLDELWSDA